MPAFLFLVIVCTNLQAPIVHLYPKNRYLKSIFPKADETLLLDTLANADNNVQHASEHLLTLGYDKRDTTAPKVTNRHREEQVMRERHLAENTPPPQPKVRTNEEKQRSMYPHRLFNLQLYK